MTIARKTMLYQERGSELVTIDSSKLTRSRIKELLVLRLVENPPGETSQEILNEHIILVNEAEQAYRVERWIEEELHSYFFCKKHIVVLPAGLKYRANWYGYSKNFVISLQPEALQQFALSELGIFLSKRQLNTAFFYDIDLVSLVEMMVDSLFEDAVASSLLFDTLARVFLIKLLRKVGVFDDKILFSGSFTAQNYSILLEYIEDNYAETITVEDLAELVAMSIAHFSRLFKKATGKSPMAFVASYRVEQAKKRLERENISFADIAYQCGFTDQSHFNRVFKKVEGQTPKVYRDAFLQD